MNRWNRRYSIAGCLFSLMCFAGLTSCKNSSSQSTAIPGPPMKGVPGRPDAQGSEHAMYEAIDKAMAKRQNQQQPQGGK